MENLSLFNKHSNCLVCGNSQITNLNGYEKAFLVKCSNCGFVFSERIPTNEELNFYYSNYGSNFYCSDLTIKRYNEILDKMEPFRQTGRLLDIGCGIGFFLDEAKKRSWEVYGTEYSERLIGLLREKGITIHDGQLNSENYEEGFFDIVTSFEVIEHINNPTSELKQIATLLRKGGLVYLTTPNFNSLLRRRLKIQYNVIKYPEHLSYYTPKSLSRLFHLNGFKKLQVETTGISLTRLRTSQGTSAQKFVSASSDDEKLRQQMDEKWYLGAAKVIVNKMLTLLGSGDSLKGWFIKK
jgi:2-polyprenyl-3-methyl-5-hydroxy-6-metoxy-1,4-benzoquinol methylase